MKISVNGQMVDAERVAIAEQEELWSRYTLADGTVLKARVTINGTFRIVGQFNSTGDPSYHSDIALSIVVASAPDHLRLESITTVAGTKLQ